jgi:peroxiredoxin/uncharacterized membrane protein YphA (DoxX/SURF4 family)
MPIVALVVRLIIAATFFVAGIAKLSNRQGTREDIRDFGVPGWAASPLAILLPLAELAAAALLIPLSTVLWGSLGSVALLMIFIVGIVINLAQGRKPNCNCFGQVHSEPIGWPTLIRNCILTAGAILVFWDARYGAPISVIDWTTGLSSVETAEIFLGTGLLVAIVVEGWLTFHLLRQNGRLLLRMDALETRLGSNRVAPPPIDAPSPGLPVGTPAPAFELPALSDNSILTLDTLRAERKPIVLIFTDPDCGPCSALLPDVTRWEREHAATLTIALISRGSWEANRGKIGEHRLRYVLLQEDREVAQAYGANGTPGAVLIAVDGTIASFLAMGAQAITGLVATGASTASLSTKNNSAPALPIKRVNLQIGDTAPSLMLPDLGGKIVDLSAFKGRDTLVLFWNPNCGFCQKMLADLTRWEQDHPIDAPQLLVVSSGTVEVNREMGIRSPIVLDQGFASGRAFQVRGTPAAVLVDADGKIVSEVANGAPAVFALAKARQKLFV